MFLSKTALWSTSLMLAAVASCFGQTSTVRIRQGVLAGTQDPSGVRSFKGVPFAAPPVGDLRWKEPMPPASWTGVRQATEWGHACMQNLRRDTLPWTREFMVQNDDSEDCLYLNVWTPKPNAGANLPVLVFIHGGGFSEGSGGIDVYDGANLAKLGIVVVTINYRLGVFGFLVHPELTAESPHHSSGNYGLEDQVAALKWVRANIRAFGGNPQKVTIWGQSAGAVSVGALLASPPAKGWFNGAIADSGLGHSRANTTTMQDAEKEGETFAKSRSAASLRELRALPAAELMKAPIPQSVHFRPVIDGWMLQEPLQAALEDGTGSDVPLITGYQSEDARTLSRPPRTLEEYTRRITAAYGPFAADVLKLYPATDDKSATVASEELSHDRNRVNQWLLATDRNRTNKSATYTYFMDQAIPWPQHPEFGAFHTGELPYAFANLEKLDRPWTEKDREVSRRMAGYIVNFARTGSPNGVGLPHWPSVTAAQMQTMELGRAFGPMPLADTARHTFWLKFLQAPDAPNGPVF